MATTRPADKQPARTTKPYEHTTRAGNAYSLPSLGRLKPALAAKIARADGNPNHQLIAMQDVLDTLAPGLFDDLEDAEEMQDLMAAWQEHSGIAVGESSPS